MQSPALMAAARRYATTASRAQNIIHQVQAAADARPALAAAPLAQRHAFLRALRAEVSRRAPEIYRANAHDSDTYSSQMLAASGGGGSNVGGGGGGMLEGGAAAAEGAAGGRALPGLRLDKLCRGIDLLLELPDPLAEAPEGGARRVAPAAEGVCVRALPVPMGLVAVLARYRPRLCADAAAMAVLAGNAALLDGGAAVHSTNMLLHGCMRHALRDAGLPPAAIVNVPGSAGNRATETWLGMSREVDLAVVSGPSKLYDYAARRTRIPLLRATSRFCSLYVDASASFDHALAIIVNSKFQALSAANAVTTIILHEAFPRYAELLEALRERGALLLGDAAALARAPESVAHPASEENYRGPSSFHGDDVAAMRTLCVKTVDSLEQCMLFLDLFGSRQCDGVIAGDDAVLRDYCRRADSAIVLANASTRLASGTQLGLGSDLSLSSGKLHCRGPITVDSLVTRKIVVRSTLPDHAGAMRRD